MKNLEAQNKTLTQTNENLRKNIQELKTSLADINSILLKTKQDLEEAKKLNSNTLASVEVKEVRFYIFLIEV